VRSAVFLDRDGVINESRRDYVRSWDEFRFLPGALASLRRLASTPYAIVVVSNQSAINRGLVSRAEVNAINDRMLREIEEAGGRIDGVYICPHRPDEECARKKPKPGLLYQAAYELGIDLSSSYLVGDTLSGVTAALAAACTPILVLSDRGCKELEKGCCFYPRGFFVAPDVAGSVDSILRRSCPHRRERGNSPGTHEPATEARSGRDSEWARASAMTPGGGKGAERGIPRS